MDQQKSSLNSSRAQVAILDFGSQYTHLIARRVRELHVFCELYSCTIDVDALKANNIVGIILSGGPSSVYEPESPHVKTGVWDFIKENNIPVLGICYGMQEIAHVFGGRVQPSSEREFGRALLSTVKCTAAESLFAGISNGDIQMWMSHGDKVTALPDGFTTIAYTSNSENAAIANESLRIYGIQFHPEVTHSLQGKEMLTNFVVNICHAPTDWNMKDISENFIKEVREKVGPNGHVIGAVSGYLFCHSYLTRLLTYVLIQVVLIVL